MEGPFPAYRGDEPYVFVSYSHDDADTVFADLVGLHDDGYRIWYDDGIRAGHNWPEALAEAISGCRVLVFFASSNSASSRHCQRELHFAMDGEKPVIVVQLDDQPLPPAVKFVLGNQQALMKGELAEETYAGRLREALSEFVQPDAGKPEAGPAAVERFNSLTQTSIAIMPFGVSGSGSGLAELAEFAAEELGLLMVADADLRIASDKAVQRQVGIDADPIAIGEALDVGYVIEGALRKTGDDVQIRVELVEAATGARVWNTRINVPASGGEKYISHAMDRIRILIAQSVSTRLLDALADKPHEELDSIALTFQGQEMAQRGVGSWEEALAIFRKAIDADPRNPWPRALIANFMAIMVSAGLTRKAEEYSRIAREELAESIRLGSLQPRVLGVGASTCGQLGDHARELQLARQCYAKVQVLPSRGRLAASLIANGQLEEARQRVREIDECVPAGHVRPHSLLRDCATLGEDWDAALEHALAQASIAPGYTSELQLANVLGELDRIDEARKAVARAREAIPKLRLRTAIAGWARTYNDQSRFFRGLQKLVDLGDE